MERQTKKIWQSVISYGCGNTRCCSQSLVKITTNNIISYLGHIMPGNPKSNAGWLDWNISGRVILALYFLVFCARAAFPEDGH